MKRLKPTKQIYENYTAEDFAVWEVLFNRQMNALATSASAAYLQAVKSIGFTSNEIPHFEKVNKRLAETTGWKIITVPCICPPKDFFALLAQKTFTCTCWLRTMQELDYLEEPDMFHDVFGHVPLLTNKAYCAFFETLGKLGEGHSHQPHIIDMLERLYWFTIEFGLIKNGDELKIYGSGIISSAGETKHALSNESAKHLFDVEKIMDQHFRNDVMQDDYFVIENFEQLINSIPQVKEKIRANTMVIS